MEQPEDFNVKCKEEFVYKLHKGLYGLKLAKRQWFNSQQQYKARLIMEGFCQKKGDFEEIFSLVGKMSYIRVVLGLAGSLNLEIEQLDIKTTFLPGDFEEEECMEQPEEFSVKGKEESQCNLKKKNCMGYKQQNSSTQSLICLQRIMTFVKLGPIILFL